MGENPKYPKVISRGSPDDSSLMIGETGSEVEYTSGWEGVEGGRGVKCRTWKIKNLEADVDGADIVIEAGGFTPVQLVKVAEVVVDAPEEGKAYCCVMDTDGTIYVNYFDGEEKSQMVWSKGMVIFWIAETEVRLTEFESPSFNPEMFATVPEDATEYQGIPMTEYLEVVRDLKGKVVVSK